MMPYLRVTVGKHSCIEEWSFCLFGSFFSTFGRAVWLWLINTLLFGKWNVSDQELLVEEWKNLLHRVHQSSGAFEIYLWMEIFHFNLSAAQNTNLSATQQGILLTFFPWMYYVKTVILGVRIAMGCLIAGYEMICRLTKWQLMLYILSDEHFYSDFFVWLCFLPLFA